ncbi:MAG: YybH family protein [Acidobacteriota bacterium]
MTETILSIERAALDRWVKGDPDGFLDIYDPDIVYFDPFLDRRMDGLDALRAYYNSFRGQVRADRYEIVCPKVQSEGDMAVLTFNFVSWTGDTVSRWNAAEVYRRKDGQWRIIHANWQLTRPRLCD